MAQSSGDRGAPPAVAAVVPARDEAAQVASTVRAVRTLPGLRHVVVVDDGSLDATARRAAEAGAVVLRHRRSRGRAAALTTGADRVAQLDAEAGLAPSVLLFVDADLGAGAGAVAALVDPVLRGEADMTIAVPPPGAPAGAAARGGGAAAARLSGFGIRSATGFTASRPLSGVRCLSREAFEAARPLAAGWGADPALTIDLLVAGLRVREVACDLPPARHPGRARRARQLRDVGRALAVRRTRRAVPLRVLGALRGLRRARR